MLYLLDANVLITAHDNYYPIDRVPEFWSWLAHKAENGDIKIPLEIYEEIKDGGGDSKKDLLFNWISDPTLKEVLVLDEEVDPALVAQVVITGYASDLTDEQVEQIGRDPFLIAYALASPADRCVVTNEASKPNRIRQNRHIPDVCKSLGMLCCNTFEMSRSLNFSTSWKP